MERVNIKDIDKYENRMLARDIYCYGNLIMTKGSVLTKDSISILKEIKEIYIFNIFLCSSEDNSDLLEFGCSLMEEINEVVELYLTEIINKSYNEEKDKSLIRNVVKLFLEKIIDKKYFLNYLENILLINQNLFEHIIRVTILSLVISIKANLPKNMIEEIGIGAIIHDIGKLKLYIRYPQLMNEMHDYTFDEYQIIKTHTIIGYKEIELNKEIPIESKKIVLMHHIWENFEASYSNVKQTYISYPMFYEDKRLTYQNKDIAVRIVQLANYYDALIRSYAHSRDINDKLEAIKYLQKNSENIFTKKVGNLLFDYISIFSIGDRVILNDNRMATVISHTPSINKPIVKVDNSTELINLSKNKQLTINNIYEGGEVDERYKTRCYNL